MDYRSPSALARANISAGSPISALRGVSSLGGENTVTQRTSPYVPRTRSPPHPSSSASALAGGGLSSTTPVRSSTGLYSSSVTPLASSPSAAPISSTTPASAAAGTIGELTAQDHLIKKQIQVDELTHAVDSLRKKLSSAEQSVAHYMEMHRLADERGNQLGEENSRLQKDLQINARTKAMEINNLEHSVNMTLREADDELKRQHELAEKLRESEQVRDGLCERLVKIESENSKLRNEVHEHQLQAVNKVVLLEAVQRSSILVQASDELCQLIQSHGRQEINFVAHTASLELNSVLAEKDEALQAFKDLSSRVQFEMEQLRRERSPSPKTHRGTNPDAVIGVSVRVNQEQQTTGTRHQNRGTQLETPANASSPGRTDRSQQTPNRPRAEDMSQAYVNTTVSRIKSQNEFNSSSAADEIASWRDFAESLKFDLEKERAAGDRLREALAAVHSLEDPKGAPSSVALIVRDGELSSLRHRLEETLKKNDILTASEAKLRFQLRETTEECSKLNDESVILHNAIRKLQLEVRTEKRQRETERDEVQTSVADASAKMQSQESDLLALRAQVSQLKAVERQQQEDLNAAVSQAEELQHRVDVLTKEPRPSAEAHRALKISLETANTELDATNNTVVLLQNRMRELEKSSANMTYYQERQKALEGNINERDKKIEVLEGRVAALTLTHDEMSTELAKASHDNSILRVESTRNKMDADSLRQVSQTSEAKVSSLQQELEQLKPLLMEYQQRLAAVPPASVIAAEAGVQATEALQLKLNSAAEQLVSAASEIEALTTENDELRALVGRYRHLPPRPDTSGGSDMFLTPGTLVTKSPNRSRTSPVQHSPGAPVAALPSSKSTNRAGANNTPYSAHGRSHGQAVPQLSSSHLQPSPGDPNIHTGGRSHRSISSRQF